MRRGLLILLLALVLGGCERLDQRGMALMVEPGYRAEILLTEQDGITSPDGLHWAGDTLYIADEGGHALRAWKPGGPVRTLADQSAGLASPEDVVRGQDGTLFVTDDTAGGVWEMAPGKPVGKLGEAGGFPTEGIALTPVGTLLIGDTAGHRIVEFDGDGEQRPLGGGRIAKPESFAWDAAGRLFIADNKDNVLYVRGRDGKLERRISGQAGFSPESIHFAGEDLFITDSKHGKLFRYNEREGLKVIAVFAGEMENLQGITSDGDRNLFLSIQSDLEQGRGFVVKLSRSAS